MANEKKGARDGPAGKTTGMKVETPAGSAFRIVTYELTPETRRKLRVAVKRLPIKAEAG